MDLAHVRAAYVIDGGTTAASSVVDESAQVKSATAAIEAQPHVLALLLLARGVEFVLSPSYRLPMSPQAATNLTKLVTRVAGGEHVQMSNPTSGAGISGGGGSGGAANNNAQASGATAAGATTATTSSASLPSAGDQKTKNSNKQDAATDPAFLTNINSQSSAIISKNVSEIVYYALHTQPIIIQQQQIKAAVEAQQNPAPLVANNQKETGGAQNNNNNNSNNKRSSSKEGKKDDHQKSNAHQNHHYHQDASGVDRPLAEMSESETSCIAFWGASI